MISATTSMVAKVIRYCASDTAKSNRGGTNMKSKAATPSTELRIAARRPAYTATSAVLSR